MKLTRPLIAGFAAVALFAAACSSDDDPAATTTVADAATDGAVTDDGPAEPAPPAPSGDVDTWAVSFCGATDAFLQDMFTQMSAAFEDPDASEEALTAAMQNVVSTYIGALRSAGAPPIEGGAEFTAEYIAALEEIEASLAAGDASAVERMGDEFGERLEAVLDANPGFEAALQDVSTRVPECAALSG